MTNNPQVTSPNFHMLFQKIEMDFRRNSERVATERWQGWNTQGRLDYESHELLNYNFTVDLKSIEDLDHWRKEVTPNLPWADDHFLERVSGHPMNPGKEWANWPWGKSAAKHRQADEKFNHNYMERYFPKYARQDCLSPAGMLPENLADFAQPHKGICHIYGDMMDVVKYLVKEPHTRQAYIPIFFPEDTGFGDGGRKPCTLGYQFIMRNNRLSVYYPLRSCDFSKHFKDDIYLTIRLLLWVLDECRKLDPKWNDVKPGFYTMHMTSFHMFYNDWVAKFGKESF